VTAIAALARHFPPWPRLTSKDEAGAPPGATTDVDLPLIERFRAGDRRAFDELVRRYQKPLYFVARRYLRNDADAADVTQKSFVRAFRGIDRFRGQSTVRTWLYRIAINQSLNHLRDHRREEPTEIGPNTLTTSATGPTRVIAGEDARQLRAAIESLPPKQRMVLELRVFDELPFREVAALADCSENAAKVNFHYAVKRLREIVGDEALAVLAKPGDQVTR
jgi:RNA polymerase sigma-70 factor (ECF subfamily)